MYAMYRCVCDSTCNRWSYVGSVAQGCPLSTGGYILCAAQWCCQLLRDVAENATCEPPMSYCWPVHIPFCSAGQQIPSFNKKNKNRNTAQSHSLLKPIFSVFKASWQASTVAAASGVDIILELCLLQNKRYLPKPDGLACLMLWVSSLSIHHTNSSGR